MTRNKASRKINREEKTFPPKFTVTHIKPYLIRLVKMLYLRLKIRILLIMMVKKFKTMFKAKKIVCKLKK